jgi:hypothetical protein
MLFTGVGCQNNIAKSFLNIYIRLLFEDPETAVIFHEFKICRSKTGRSDIIKMISWKCQRRQTF